MKTHITKRLSFSKRWVLKRYIGMTEEEIINNEKIWRKIEKHKGLKRVKK